MNLSFTKKHKMIQKNMRKFSREILKDISHTLDRDSTPLPEDIRQKMSDINIYGIQAPLEFGGADLDTISYSIVIEEISRVSASIGLGVTVHNSVCLAPIVKYGTEEQKKRFLPDLASGKKIGGFTVTEPNAGSDAGGLRTTAVEDGDSYILNGQKAFVTNGGTGEIFLTGALFAPEKKNRGIGIFIVEKKMEGFRVGKIEDMMGMRGNMVSELFLKNVRVPKKNILGRLDDGFKISMQTLDMGRIGIASQALGIGMAAFEAAAEYATERKQFGKPIGTFQGISFKLAEMKTKLEASRMLIYKAADLKDKGLPYTEASAMCKMYAPQVAQEVCQEALQIFGGYGYVKELPVERYYRDVKITQIYEGTTEIMKIIVGNSILKEFSKI